MGVKRKRPGQSYDEDEKLLHQATRALKKEAKRVRAFLLQQAIRKGKAATERQERKKTQRRSDVPSAGVQADRGDDESAPRLVLGSTAAGRSEGSMDQETSPDAKDSDGVENSSDLKGSLPVTAKKGSAAIASSYSEEIALVKSFDAEALVKLCLRRLGLAYTGPAGEDEVKIEGSARLRKLVTQTMEHKRIASILEEFQERVTARRRTKLAILEGRHPQGKGSNAGRGQGRVKRNSTQDRFVAQATKHTKGPARGQSFTVGGSAFVSLSGEVPSDEEWATGPISRTKRAVDGRGGLSDGRQSLSASWSVAAKASRKSDSEQTHEPGWAGVDRAAGWGRGGGRRLRAGRGQERNASNTGHKASLHGSSSRAGRGADVGARSNGQVSGHSGGGFGGRGARSDPGADAKAHGGGDGGVTGEGGGGGEGLHGSWAAKRALKEKEASATKAFSGKRIQFDDDDD